ncbi:MAG: low temperature requirement protein A [Ignavibacteria bacterium]|nr:low temperature requirement protein A [Ignavibacteria bacterium]
MSGEGHRKVSWLELFFDLFFVVTVSQLAHGLVGNTGGDAVRSYLLLFVPVWWMWVGTTIYMERFETEGLETRVMYFALMFPVAGLAVFAHSAFSYGAVGFGLSYIAGRVIITLLWARASIHAPEFRPTGWIFILGFSLSIVLFTISLWTSQETRSALWGAGLFIDLITPWFTLKRQRRLPRMSTSKFPERLGLFILIVLGESVVGVVNGIASAPRLDVSAIVPASLGIAVGFGLWWVYFDYVARRVPKRTVLSSIIWSYLHLPLAMGIAAIGAAITNAILYNAGSIIVNPSPLLLGAAGVTLLAMGGLERTLHREGDEPTHPVISPLMKVTAGLLLLGLAPFARSLPIVSAFFAVLAVLLVQMLYGLWVWFTEGHGEAGSGE